MAATVHVREADADTYQEWKSTLAVAPTEPLEPPRTRGTFKLADEIRNCLPVPGTQIKAALRYGMSLWGETCKIEALLPSGKRRNYLLKVLPEDIGEMMTKGEFESLKAMHAVSPGFVPEPYSQGSYIQDGHKYWYLLVEFKLVGEQPPDPEKFVEKLVEMHKKSVSPTGMFGFHVTTFHGKVAQMTNQWDESWSTVFQRHLGHMVVCDEEVNGYWPEFKVLCDITLGFVLPRLLEALQSNGRSIKPCLVHGDLWDENTATDMRNGEPFVFDPGSMYAHNEYETGNWRAVRHRLSSARYVGRYQSLFKRSEPKEEWGSRNILYSLRYNLGAAILFPGCAQRKDVYDDMTYLCNLYYAGLLTERITALRLAQWSIKQGPDADYPIEQKDNDQSQARSLGDNEEEEEEEEEEEDEDEDEEAEEEEEEPPDSIDSADAGEKGGKGIRRAGKN